MSSFRTSLVALLALGLATAAVAQTVRSDRLLNLSSRSRIVAGQSELIAGFVIGGTQPKRVLLRGIGPALSGFGVADAVALPRLRLFDAQGRSLREVFGWGGDVTLAATFARLGAFPLTAGSTDAAILTTLAPGTYTLQVTTTAGAGSVLAEIYDATEAAPAQFERLINISARGPVETNSPLIGGFVIGGTTSKRVLVRGVGPGLTPFSVGGPLADPRLRVYRGAAVIAENDNWSGVAAEGTAAAAAASSTGAFTLAANSRDAALILTLAAGEYTAQVTATDGTSTGVALVEIYELPD